MSKQNTKAVAQWVTTVHLDQHSPQYMNSIATLIVEKLPPIATDNDDPPSLQTYTRDWDMQPH